MVFDSGLVSTLLAAWPALQYLAPTLAGQVIETEAFCAAGPQYTPPVTFGDIVWVGFAPQDNRPHTILSVTRAIAEQEAFALYCEDPGNPTASWHLIDDGCHLLEASGQDVVFFTSTQLPNTSTKVRYQYISGPFGGVHTAVTGGGRHIDQTGIDTLVAPETGKLTGPDTPLGQTVIHDFTSWRSTNQNFPIWPALYVGGGQNPSGVPMCGVFEWWGTDAGGNYEPPANDVDPTVTLPDGTGATLDQLEVKLDAIQQQLGGAGAAFALDLGSTQGPLELLAGDLGDAVGLMVTIVDIPNTRSAWDGSPDRYPQMAYITFGNTEGWWPATEVQHAESVWLPLPRGASRYAVQCQPPMRATVTPYRPVLGP